MLKKILSCVFLTTLLSPVHAQEYPARPITLIAPFPPGGGTDFLARTLAQTLSEQNGWDVVVHNKPGASGTIGLNTVASEKPDGYHIVMGQVDNAIIAPAVLGIPSAAIESLTPVAGVAWTPPHFFVPSNSPHHTMADVVRAAKKAPQPLSYGTAGTGSYAHLTYEVIQANTGIELMHVPYKGAAPAFADLASGRIDLSGGSIASAGAMLTSGRIRLLEASTPPDDQAANRAKDDAKSPYGLDLNVWYAVFSPPGVDERIVEILNKAISRAIQAPQVIESFNRVGLKPMPLSVNELDNLRANDQKAWKQIISSTGVSGK